MVKDHINLNRMNKVTMGFGVLAYLPVLIFLSVCIIAIVVGINRYIEFGWFSKKEPNTFYIILFATFGFLFILLRVLPAYKVLLDRNGIRREYTVHVGKLVLYRDRYGEACWSDITFITPFSNGWIFNHVALHYSVNGKGRMILVGPMFWNFRNASECILDNIGKSKIDSKALVKLKNWSNLSANVKMRRE